MVFCQARCRSCAGHVDHQARTRHNPAFVGLDDPSVDVIIRAKVIGVDN
jgi:glycerol kinase